MERSQGTLSPRQDSENVAQAKRILRGEAATAEAMLALAAGLKNEKAFGFARKVLARARTLPVEKTEINVKLTQQHALCTYKDPDLPVDSRLDTALEILQHCEKLEDTKNQETLGLAGAIFKRKWEVNPRKENLERSLSYYLRGYEQGPEKDFGYTGINAAYVLDLLANLEDEEAKRAGAGSGVAEERHHQALTIRKKLVRILPALPEDSRRKWLRKEWWFYATLAEACFGLGQYADASAWIKKGRKIRDVPAWEFESTATQLASLARLLGKRHSTATDFAETEAAGVLNILFGRKAEGVQTAYLGKVGLALSGGGFRASLFHIGVLARLAELDMLRHVEVLSCVSGGSILGAHYYLEIRKLLKEKNEEDITSQDYIDIVRRLQREFLSGVQKNVRSRILSEFITNLKMVFLPGYSRTLRAGELFESLIYRRVQDGEERQPRWLTNLFIIPKGEDPSFAPKKDNWRRRAKVPDLILNATSLNTGHNWQFTASWMGEPPGSISTEIDGNYRLRRMYFWEAPKNHQWIRLGHAVAASACVPGLFEPLPFRDLYPGKTVRLVDGGVHDNQGIVSLLEQDCKVLLVSDASGQMDNQDDPSSGLLGVPMRANSILQSRVRESQYEDLQSAKRGGLVRGLMFVHLKKDLDVDPIDWLHCEDPFEASDDARPPARRGPLTRYGIRKDLQRSLAAIRTDLDSFNDAEAYALMTSGYRMTEYEFAQSIKEFPGTNAKNEKWDFLQIEDTMKNLEQAQRLKRLLDTGSQRAFKVWRLSTPLKSLAAVLGVVAILGIAWSVWTFHSTSLLTVGVLGLAVGAMVLTVLFSKGMFRVVNLRNAFEKVGAGIVLAFVGPLLFRPHLWFFDRIYLWMGKIDRFSKQLKRRRKMPRENRRKGVFIGYSHSDKKWLEKLRTVLKPVLSGETIWDDSQIRAGESWANEIEDAIASSRVAVLLVTPHFLASDFIVSEELPRIIERQTKEGLTIVWIAVEPAMYSHTILAKFQAANDPGRPLSTLKKSDQDKELVQIAERILAAANVNAVANVLRAIDTFEPQAKAFVEGRDTRPTETKHSIVARQEPGQDKITVGQATITGEDLAKLDSRSRQLIRALELAMNDLFDRWVELEPKRSARDLEIRQTARKESDEVRQEICDRLNQIFNYLGFIGKHLEDHYSHVRFICQQPAKPN